MIHDDDTATVRQVPDLVDTDATAEAVALDPRDLGVGESYVVTCPCCGRRDVVTPVTADLRIGVRGEQWARYYPRAAEVACSACGRPL